MGASRKHGQSSETQAPQAPGSVFDPLGPELPGQSAGHELEGMLERGAAEDPLFRFLKKRWQSMLMLVLAVVVVVYGRSAILSGREADMKRAADTFAAVRQQLVSRETLIGRIEELTAKDKKSDEEQKQLDSLLKERASIDERVKSSLAALKTEREPYQALAQVYEAQVLPGGAEAEGIEKQLTAALQAFESARTQDEDEVKFFSELATLRLARLALGEDKTFPSGVAALRTLLEQGSYVQISAAQSLVRSMSMQEVPASAEEKASLRKALEQAAQKQPALAEQFENLLERIGN